MDLLSLVLKELLANTKPEINIKISADIIEIFTKKVVPKKTFKKAESIKK